MNILLAVALTGPAPSLDQFPPREVCLQGLAFLDQADSKIRYAIKHTEDYNDRVFLQKVLVVIAKRRRIWDLACVASHPEYRWYDTYYSKSQVVKELLNVLNEENFLEGRLPDPIPLWAFTEK